MAVFKPKVIGILCNWCSYDGADAAGRARRTYPPGFLPLRVMCSGRVDPQLVMEAFAQGADGVLVLGCHPGGCHYRTGNEEALRRVSLLRRLLDQMGIDQDRLRLDWVSASQGEHLAEVVSRMIDRLGRLGPLHRGPRP